MAQQTLQERAEELVNKFIKPTIKWNPINGVGYYNDMNAAKECAIIAVDEIINILNSDINPLANYWYEVKTEIEKL
jgi:hypothetical protein